MLISQYVIFLITSTVIRPLVKDVSVCIVWICCTLVFPGFKISMAAAVPVVWASLACHGGYQYLHHITVFIKQICPSQMEGKMCDVLDSPLGNPHCTDWSLYVPWPWWGRDKIKLFRMEALVLPSPHTHQPQYKEGANWGSVGTDFFPPSSSWSLTRAAQRRVKARLFFLHFCAGAIEPHWRELRGDLHRHQWGGPDWFW